MAYTKTFENRQSNTLLSGDAEAAALTLRGLHHHRRWCAWQIEMRAGRNGKQKPCKVPYGLNQQGYKSNDPTTWVSFEHAGKLLNVLWKPTGIGGVGISLGILQEIGEGYALIGFDLDSCIDAGGGGGASDWAVEVLDALGDVYWEISPSGTGLKVFTLARTDTLSAVRDALGILRWKRSWKAAAAGRDGGRGGDAHAAGIEAHTGNHYFTVTGTGEGALGLIGVGEAEAVRAIAERVFGAGGRTAARGAGGDVEVTDAMIRDVGALLPDGLEALSAAEQALIERLPRVKALWTQTFALGADKTRSTAAWRLGGELRRAGVEAEVGIPLMLKCPWVWDRFMDMDEWQGRRQVARDWYRHGAGEVGSGGGGLGAMKVPRVGGAAVGADVTGGGGGGGGGWDDDSDVIDAEGVEDAGGPGADVVELRYDAATVRRLVEAAEPGEAARLFLGLVGQANLNPLEREDLVALVSQKAKVTKSALRDTLKEVVRAARKAQSAASTAADWQDLIQLNGKGEPYGNLANATLFMRQAPELAGVVSYDLMMRRVHLNRRVPNSGLGEPGPLQDTDVSEIQEWIQRNGVETIGREVMQQAISVVARENGFHPVQDYLNGLVWDGKLRLDTWLKTYLGASAQSAAYLKVIGRCFILSMIYRIMQPGCQCDYMIVLEGAQGDQKTTACNVLAGDWFSNSLPDLHGHDDVRVSMHLRGKWLIEIGELSAFRKSDMDKLKNFLTRRTESYIPKYGQNEVEEGRQCVTIGTTNDKEYLRDATGGRRFWPVDVGFIDISRLTADRDQLFAEAMAGYRAHEQYWPSKEVERDLIKGEQDARYETDMWQETIQAWLKNPAVQLGGVMPPVEVCTTKEIALGALKLDIGRHDVVVQRRIAGVMRLLQWAQNRKTRIWSYEGAAHITSVGGT